MLQNKFEFQKTKKINSIKRQFSTLEKNPNRNLNNLKFKSPVDRENLRLHNLEKKYNNRKLNRKRCNIEGKTEMNSSNIENQSENNSQDQFATDMTETMMMTTMILNILIPLQDSTTTSETIINQTQTRKRMFNQLLLRRIKRCLELIL